MAWKTPKDSWRNPRLNTQTEIKENHQTGDVLIKQNNRSLSAHYEYWPAFLMHGILYCLQTGEKVPYMDKWHETFPIATPDQLLGFDKSVLLRDIISKVKREQSLLLLEDNFCDSEFIVSSDSKYFHFPYLRNRKLEYISQDGLVVAKFDNLDMPDFFDRVLDPMVRNIRGHRFSPGRVYSEFPWQAYEKVLGKN